MACHLDRHQPQPARIARLSLRAVEGQHSQFGCAIKFVSTIHYDDGSVKQDDIWLSQVDELQIEIDK